MRISKTIKVVGSLVLGLGLVCGLLWVLAPESAAQVEAQAEVEIEEDGGILDDCETIDTTTALNDAAPRSGESCVQAPD